ncbi:MAG TPA: 30S ribosome-binding factor RbfA [Candidatus Kapabacteria bacterium]|nr:30S ribosome-binding factor RbfA [Candidatus Kapabacteria bacterium]
MSVRTERVGAMLREALSTMFQRHLPEYLDGMITIVSVKMSPDLRIAKVYASIFRSTTDPDTLIKRMNTHAPELRHDLASRVTMRFIPELRFYRDDTLDAAEHIDKLLRQVRRDDEARGLHPYDEERPDQPSAGENND